MQKTMTARLEQVAKLRHELPQNVIAQAIEIGVSRMYMDSILARYLKKRLSRRQAVQAVGLEAVQMAETQQTAVREDVAWGLRA